MFYSFIWFSVSLVALVFAQRWLHYNLQRLLLLIFRDTKVSFFIYAVLLLPGVVLHELSHWLAAKVLGVGTRSFTLIPTLRDDGSIRFGSVETDRADPVRSALIGVAPLVTGAMVLSMLVFENLGLASLLRGIEQYDLEALALLWSRLQAHPELAIWLYLAIVVSNTMLPSAADRSAWVPVGLILGFLAVATMLFGLGPEAAALISSPLDMFLRGFAGLFTLTIALDIMLIVPLMIVQQFVRWFVRLLT
jgi:hypothetical protein